MKEKDCEECEGRGRVYGDAGGGNVEKVACRACDGRGRVPVDEVIKEGGIMTKPIIRAFLTVFLCLGALAVIAFLIVVDIIDDISRDQDRWQMTEAVLQDSPSVKLSDGD